MKRTTKSIQAEIAKGAFRPHTALSTMALAYYQQETTSFAKNMFPVCPVQLSSDNYYVFDKEDLLRDNWNRKPAYGSVDTAVISEHTENYACHVDQMMKSSVLCRPGKARHPLFREEAIRRCMYSERITHRCSVRA